MVELVLKRKLMALVPAPRLVPPLLGMRVPKLSLHEPGSVVLTRNQPVVAAPLGLAAPFSWAEVLVSADAAAVVTAGRSCVVNDTTEPNAVPSELDAIAQT